MAYGSSTGLVAYLTASGRALPAAADPDVLLFWGSLYVDSFEQCYRGTALQDDASFPRVLWPVVPVNVEYAAYEAAFAYASGVAIFGSGGTAGGQVVREKVDVLEVQYAAPTDGSGWWQNNQFILPQAYALLLPFMKRKGWFYPSAMVVGCGV